MSNKIMGNRTKCKQRVTSPGMWSRSGPCSRYAIGSHGYCKQHSPETVEKKAVEQDARYKKEYAEYRLKRTAPELLEALESIKAELDDCSEPGAWESYDKMKAAIAKAKGEDT